MTMTYTYWISTALLSALYLSSAALYLTKRGFVEKAQADLGYHAAHLVQFMIVVKILGPLAILTRLSLPLSDLAYAGIFYHLILSGMAHLGVRSPKDAIPAALASSCWPHPSRRKTTLAMFPHRMLLKQWSTSKP
ncbi:hypothetical protein M2315_003942 [Agrobacterium fabrum]|nr:hypothetical protein [Agrobacterium fabrum]